MVITTEQISESLQRAIERSNINLIVNAYREYGERRSAGFELIDPESEETLFTMDISSPDDSVNNQVSIP